MSSNLKGLQREKLGSRYARALRKQGRIPVSVQGGGRPHVHLSLAEDEFLAARRHHEHLFEIDLGAGQEETVLVRELQWDAFGERIAHVEFRRVIRGQKTEVEVEIEFSGHPKGGVLNHILTHVTVAALPAEIPDSIEVNVDAMEPGHPLLAGDLPLPAGVDLLTEKDAQVAVVALVRAEEAPQGEGEGEGEEGAAAPAETASEDSARSEE